MKKLGFVLLMIPGMVMANPKIADYAVSKMTQKSYPKMYQKLGKKAFDRANVLMLPAAELASKSKSCDVVESVGVSEKSTSSNIEFFIDCKNWQRIRINEKDISKGSDPVTEAQKTAGISDAEAVKMCTDKVKAMLNFPSTFKSSLFKQAVIRHKTLGNIEVRIDFEAKNYLGVGLPASARCIITKDGLADNDVVITNR